jgi:hypothetical protein
LYKCFKVSYDIRLEVPEYEWEHEQ